MKLFQFAIGRERDVFRWLLRLHVQCPLSGPQPYSDMRLTRTSQLYRVRYGRNILR